MVKAERALEDVNATTDLITASITGLKNSVRNTATEMVRNIRLAEEEMITEIDRIQSRKFHGLKQQTKRLQDNLETFEYGKTYAEHAFKYLSEVSQINACASSEMLHFYIAPDFESSVLLK